METLFTSDYLLACFCTICVAVLGLLGPAVTERDMPATYSADDASKLHCKIFGWPMFVGGIALLFGALFAWSALAMVIAGEALMFGVMYFIGLVAHEHDKANFVRRCRAVCRRYQESLGAFFGQQHDENNKRKKPDLEFMKKVEAHSGVEPDKIIRMRIQHAQLMLGEVTCLVEVEAMVERYVRAGGTA
jgi:hypothetical protein